jgi:hypothetical protein
LKGRDLAIVAAVIFLGGFALADSLRSPEGEARETTTETTDSDGNGPEPQADAPVDWPSGRLRGTLVFTDAEDCRVRVIGLGGGRERPTGDFPGFCDLWAAPVGQRIAYSTAGSTREDGAGWFSIVDLAHANFEPATFKGLIGDVLWSPDAQRAAWCDESGVGLELEIGNERPRRIARCPIAYTPEGRLTFAVGGRLISAGRVLLAENEPILQASYAQDESLLVVLASGIVRRYGVDGRIDAITIKPLSRREIIPSPGNCAVLYEDAPGRIQLVDIGCAGVRARSFFAFGAAWSPDGRWVAVADQEQIEFHEVLSGNERLVWPARARELYWRGN